MSKYIDKDKVLEYIIFGVVGKDITCGELARAIESLPTIESNEQHEEWVLCSERLPKNEGWVIVTILDEYGDTPYRYTGFGWYLEVANCWIIDAEQRTDVIAWMPLPKPYREGGKA